MFVCIYLGNDISTLSRVTPIHVALDHIPTYVVYYYYYYVHSHIMTDRLAYVYISLE